MARTLSTMMPLGTKAPAFTLPNTLSNQDYTLAPEGSNKATVIMFICNHCPFVIHVLDGLLELTHSYAGKEVQFIAISSNDVVNYPQDHPDKMRELGQEQNFTFPYLYDATQEVAKAYDAACTPDFFVFDEQLTCTYRGQLDGSRPGNGIPVTGKDLRMAIEETLQGVPVSIPQHPSMGCNIKWLA